jgi:uncharacterized SAM-binding protein YcdF (DUF218 family)
MSYLQLLLLVCLSVSAAGYLRIRDRPRPRLLSAGLLALFLLSWPPAEWLFSRPLEIWYPLRPFPANSHPEAIVVLGGTSSPPTYQRPFALADRDTFQNVSMAAWLHSRLPNVPILACEGSHRPYTYPSPMYEFLKNAGIPGDLLWLESSSRNTHENALYGAAILRAHGIAHITLVTDAQSMPRALACFRKLGFDVAAAPSDFSELDFGEDLLPGWKAIERNERTLHELLGLAWYRVRGWI